MPVLHHLGNDIVVTNMVESGLRTFPRHDVAFMGAEYVKSAHAKTLLYGFAFYGCQGFPAAGYMAEFLARKRVVQEWRNLGDRARIARYDVGIEFFQALPDGLGRLQAINGILAVDANGLTQMRQECFPLFRAGTHDCDAGDPVPRAQSVLSVCPDTKHIDDVIFQMCATHYEGATGRSARDAQG
jgi:hypothetical protein